MELDFTALVSLAEAVAISTFQRASQVTYPLYQLQNNLMDASMVCHYTSILMKVGLQGV